MKKYILLVLFLAGILSKSYAAAGNARDGLLFSMVLIGFLLIIAGILFFIDFIKKNGKRIIQRLMAWKKEKAERQDDREESLFDWRYVPDGLP